MTNPKHNSQHTTLNCIIPERKHNIHVSGNKSQARDKSGIVLIKCLTLAW